MANQGRGRTSWRIGLASCQYQTVGSCPEGNAATAGVKKLLLSLSSPPDPSGLPLLGLFVSEFESALSSLCLCLSRLASSSLASGSLLRFLFLHPGVVTPPVPLYSPPRLSQLLRSPCLPPLSLTHQFSLSPGVSCLLMSLCLFCFPLHNLPFPPSPPFPPACRPIWLAGGGEIWGGGRLVSQTFCLPFVSQRTWEN